MFVTTCALHAPVFNHMRSAAIYSFQDIINHRNWWRLFTSKLVFLDIKDLICSCLLLYYFRVFERRMGSRRYASHLLSSLILSSILEVGLIFSIEWYTGVVVNFLPSGPLPMIFSLFVNFFFDIPNARKASLFGIPFSGKALAYFLGVQILAGSRGSLISATAGVLSGLILRMTPKPFNLIPKPIANFFSWSFSFFESEAPEEGPFLLGATLEIQREQQMELMEQQMMMTSMEEMMRSSRQFDFQRRPSGSNNIPVGLSRSVPPPAPFVLPASASSSPGPSSTSSVNGGPRRAADEESIRTLVEMGFNREQVIDALRRSNNDVTTATSILLE